MALGGAELARLKIVLDLDASTVGKGYAAATVATQGFASSTEAAFGRVKQAGNQLTELWSGLSTGQKALAGFGVGAALVGTALATTIKPAIEFESAFAGVKKTVDTTPAGMERIRTGLLDLSKIMPTSAKDLAQIAENAGQLGVAAPQILKFTEVVAQLGETTDLSFDQASTELARFLNITGGGAALIDPVSNALVALGNAGASTESEIVNFSQRLASAVTVAGGSEDQILALASAFSSFGVNAEAGGSALSTIITSIADSARGGNDNLELFAKTAGLLPEQFAQIARTNPVEALILFGEGLGKVVREGGSVTPIMKELELGGLRTSEVMRLLALNSDQVREALRLSAEEFANGTARQDEYDKRTETTASRLETLRNRLTAVQIAVGTNFLSGLAIGADVTGDALAKLLEILDPLVDEIVVLAKNAGTLGAGLADALGGPALKAAVAVLIGATQALTGLLAALNSIGPTGLGVVALLTTLAGFGPGVRPLVFVMDNLAASIYRMATAGSVGQAAMMGLNTALAVGPWILAAALLAAVGKSMVDAGNAAEVAGGKIEERFNTALKAGNFAEAEATISQVRDRMRELDEIDKVSKDWGGGLESWGAAFKNIWQIATPGTENAIMNARAEMERLDQIAKENGFEEFGTRFAEIADRMGITRDQAVALADNMGLLDQVTKGSAEEFAAARDAMVGFGAAQEAAAELMGKTTGELLTQIDDLPKLSDALDVTSDNLLYVAEGMKGLNFDDLFSTDAEVRMNALNALLDEITGKWAPMADAVGLTTNEVIDQNRAVGALAGSYDELRSAIDSVVSALNSLNDPAAKFAESSKGFDEALKGVNGEMTTLVAAAQAGRQAIADFAGTAPEFDDLIAKQAEFAGRLYDAGIQAGYTRDAVLSVVAESLRIPTGVLIEILAKADQAKTEADTVRQDLYDLTEEEWRVLIDGDPELARVKLGIYKQELTDFVSSPYTATVGLENQEAIRKIGESKLAATDFAGGRYDAPLTATNSDALSKTSQASDEANRYARNKYDASLTATNSDAISKAQAAETGANRFKNGSYDAKLTATNSDAVAKTGTAEGTATKYARNYNATLTATDNASGTISGAVAKLAGFVSKTITLTTVQHTSYTSSSVRPTGALAGAIIGSGGARTFAAGGVFGGGADYLMGARANVPAFYPAIPSWARIFGEPATGGEWYLPARGDRARQFAIWSDAGRKLGFSGAAGRQISLSVSAPINIDARGTNMDPAALGAEVDRRVTEAMSRAGRELLNLR